MGVQGNADYEIAIVVRVDSFSVGAVAEVEVVAASLADPAVDQLGCGLDLDSVGQVIGRGDKVKLSFVERQAHMKPVFD